MLGRTKTRAAASGWTNHPAHGARTSVSPSATTRACFEISQRLHEWRDWATERVRNRAQQFGLAAFDSLVVGDRVRACEQNFSFQNRGRARQSIKRGVDLRQ